MDSSIIFRTFVIFFIFLSSVQAIEFRGKFLQGHFILGKTEPNSKILVGKKEVKVSKDGFFVFGIDRDQKYDLSFTKIVNGKKSLITKKVLKRKYNIQRIDGLAESKVTPPESVYKRIKKENKAIGEARAINSNLQFFKNKKFKKLALGKIPMGKPASESDVATAVCFLASSASSMITGTSIIIDGGWTAQ